MAVRAGATTKLSVSVKNDDLAVLKARAKRMHGGNVSAVFAELIAQVKRQEAWAQAVAWYGRPLTASDEERRRIDEELLGGEAQAKGNRRRKGQK